MSKYADTFWRRQAAPKVASVIAAHPEADESFVRLQLRGASQHYAHSRDARKAWEAEVEAQMAARGGRRVEPPTAQAGELFGE